MPIRGRRPSVRVYSSDAPDAAKGPPRDVQELWFSLAKLRWDSLALVPADEGGSVGPIARALAEVGKLVQARPVAAVVADALDFESVRALAERSDGSLPRPARRAVIEAVASEAGEAAVTSDAAAAPAAELVRALAAESQLIVAVPPVVIEPLAIAAARSADAVVLVVERGRTRLEAVRRTLGLIGRERVAGCILIE